MFKIPMHNFDHAGLRLGVSLKIDERGQSQEPPRSGQIYVRILGMFKTLNTQCITLVTPAAQTRKHPNNHLARIYIMT